MEDYCVIDEEKLSEYENDECTETWENYSTQDRIDHFRRHSFSTYEMNGESKYSMLRQAIKGSWYHAANLLNCPSELIS